MISVKLAAEPVEIKRRAVARALALGAGAVRTTGAQSEPSTRERMQASFARGDLATWGYGEEYAGRASDPAQLLPGARAVLTVAVPYAAPMTTRKPLRGRVSSYAWPEDYHRRMRALLAEVAAVIDDGAGGRASRVVCDTAPLAERAFAARAGLGWIGKHTNLIAPGLGSFVFVGEVVTSVALPPDEPLRTNCGGCSRCVDVCPTRALRGDYTIDATRCIADLTQRTDAIPRDLRPLMGDWVWGCDLCQLACPPTQRAGFSSGQSRAPDARTQPDLQALLHLRSGDFKRTYARSAMGWRGSAVLRRNAAVALGNTLDRSMVSTLAGAMRHDPHPLVRGHAAWALGRIGSPAAVDALEKARRDEKQVGVRGEIGAALEPFKR